MKTKSTILIIDDNKIDCLFHTTLIKRKFPNVEIEVEHHGKDGLDYIINLLKDGEHESLPIMIFADLYMPVMDGFEFLEQLKSVLEIFGHENIPVFSISSTISEDDIEEALSKDLCNGFVSKPIDSDKLGILLRNVNGNSLELSERVKSKQKCILF